MRRCAAAQRGAWPRAAWLTGLLGLACTAPAAAPQEPRALAPQAKLLPARLRRLSNIEYERSVSDLLGKRYSIAQRLPPDVRQAGYSRNAASALPPALGPRLSALADELAKDSVEERLGELAPCAAPAARAAPHQAAAASACAESSVRALATRAFRRPPTPHELAELQAVFVAGASGERGLAGGVELLLAALLQSPNLWYVSEGMADTSNGGPARAGANSSSRSSERSGAVELGGYEIASLLSYSVHGGPPDAELLRAAAAGALRAPSARERQARRLLGASDTRYHFRQFVLEWMEVDGLEGTAKNAARFPQYDALKPHMLAETESFVDEVMVNDGAALGALLGGGFSAVDPEMARFYALTSYGPRVDVRKAGRGGLLQQASFLAAHAHDNSTSPVKRGDFVLRQLMCVKLPRPTELDIEVTIPPPNAEQTTRERFSAHMQNPSCSYCHHAIDALGYTFESFDAAGARQLLDNQRPVNTSVDFELGNRRAHFQDSVELARWLAEQPEVSECFARQAFRFFSAQSDAEVEKSFLALVRGMEPSRQGSLIEILLEFVESDLFIWREAPAQPEVKPT